MIRASLPPGSQTCNPHFSKSSRASPVPSTDWCSCAKASEVAVIARPALSSRGLGLTLCATPAGAIDRPNKHWRSSGRFLRSRRSAGFVVTRRVAARFEEGGSDRWPVHRRRRCVRAQSYPRADRSLRSWPEPAVELTVGARLAARAPSVVLAAAASLATLAAVLAIAIIAVRVTTRFRPGSTGTSELERGSRRTSYDRGAVDLIDRRNRRLRLTGLESRCSSRDNEATHADPLIPS
jgi:hypothetical protein